MSVSMSLLPSDVILTGAGMVSSLGGLISGCAAARAGIVRASPLSLAVGSREDVEPQPVFGHPCPWVEGFEGTGRLVHLLWLALGDLLENSSLLSRAPARVVLLLELPPSDHRPALEEQDDRLSLEEPTGWVERFRKALLRVAPGGWQWDVRFSHRGHAGVLAAMREAQALLESDPTTLCLVGGVDSLLDEGTLEWLYSTRRLKHPNHPVGLMPGEAAGVLLLERASSYRRQQGTQPPLARMGPIVLGQESHDISMPGQARPGRVLAKVIRQAVLAHPCRDEQLGIIINDLNGQEGRAREWGSALVQCVTELQGLQRAAQWPLATSLGDVGSAWGAIAACMAARAFARGYARGSDILLCGSSEHGLRGALVLRAP